MTNILCSISLNKAEKLRAVCACTVVRETCNCIASWSFLIGFTTILQCHFFPNKIFFFSTHRKAKFRQMVRTFSIVF